MANNMGTSSRQLLLLAFTAFTVLLGKAEARVFFVFGDSLVDNDNDFLATSARADSPPYGIDYPTTVLMVASPMASTYRALSLNIIRIFQQLQYFVQYQKRVSSLIGQAEAKKLVKNALVLITLGGNDFVNNYFLVPNSLRSRQFSLPDYVTFLITEHRNILLLEARQLLVTETGPLGCVQVELAMRSPVVQRAAALFNPQLERMLNGLNSHIGSHAFTAINTKLMLNDFISNPRADGQGLYNGLCFCPSLSNLCSNRDQYAFWDPFHPSEKANRFKGLNLDWDTTMA